MSEVWHYTTLLDAFDHWQALIAGALGFTAAIGVVWVTLRREERLRKADVDALRKSLAVELRIIIPQALSAYRLLRDVTSAPLITARMVEHFSYVQTPTVYPTSASRIALLDKDAMQTVTVYALIAVAQAAKARLVRSREEDNLDPRSVGALARAYLKACEQSISILTALKTGLPHHDQRDARLIREIQEAMLEPNQ